MACVYSTRDSHSLIHPSTGTSPTTGDSVVVRGSRRTALWLAGEPISMPVYIGILMLLGIVAKNSILLIDFAIEEMERGVP